MTISSLKPHFFEDIATLKDAVMSEGELVKSRLGKAITGLIERNVDLLDEVAIGDAEVNASQIAIDDRAFKLLALHQPVAVDLRVIVAAIKINSSILAVAIGSSADAGSSIKITSG